MTQHQNTELLPCPFCGGSAGYCKINMNYYCLDCEATGPCDGEPKGWNTRPAKAVQGDKAEAFRLFKLMRTRGKYVDVRNINGPNTQEFHLECFVPVETLDFIESALTPESEGIAGKVEKPDRECIMFLMSLGFTHKIENGFHVVEGHGFKYSHIGILNIAHRIKQTFFDTLARPQEIDVEALFYATVSHLDGMQQKPCSVETVGAVRRAIDHLHSSGYLSAPDGKK